MGRAMGLFEVYTRREDDVLMGKERIINGTLDADGCQRGLKNESASCKSANVWKRKREKDTWIVILFSVTLGAKPYHTRAAERCVD